MIVHNIKGAYILKNKTSRTLRVNGGEPFTANVEILIPKPTLIEVKNASVEFVCYRRSDGQAVSKEDYISRQKAILVGSEMDYNDNRIYTTLGQKAEHQSFLSTHRYESKEVVKWAKVNFEVHIYAESGNPYILPLRMVGELSPMFRYRTSWVPLITEIGATFGYNLVDESKAGSYKTWSFSAHSAGTMKYMKINGEYAQGERRGSTVSAGTLEECQAVYDSDVKWATARFKRAEAMHTGVEAKNLVELLKMVENAQTQLGKISSKRATEGAYFTTRGCLTSLNKELQNQIDNG